MHRSLADTIFLGLAVALSMLNMSGPILLAQTSLSNTTLTSGTTNYQDPTTITAGTAFLINCSALNCSTASGTANVLFQAGTTITLLPGFVASAGTATLAFHAVIGPVITTTSIANGQAGAAYSATLVAAGGTAPYTWALATGSTLPTGLSLVQATGTISGVPSTAGSYSFSVTATDSGSPQRSAVIGNFSLVIAPAPVKTLSLTPTSLTFPTTNTGSTSATQAVQISNTGNAAVGFTTIALSGPNASDYTITSNSCGTTLAASVSCNVNIAFAPTTGGTRSASLAFTDDANGSPQGVGLTGTGQVVTKTLSLSPMTLGFSTTVVGSSSASQNILIGNTGNATVNFSTISITGPNSGDFLINSNSCGSSLAVASGSCSVVIVFAPTGPGSRSASLTVTDDATGSPQAVGLSGTALAATQILSLSPTSLNFPLTNIGTTAAAVGVSISNTGNTTINIATILITGANASDYAISSNSCSGSYAPTGSCNISVTFTPSIVGLETAAVTVTSNATASPQAVGLSGSGQAVTQAPLQIVTPANGSTVSPGQLLSVTVTPVAGLNLQTVTILGEDPLGTSAALNAAPYQTTIQLPSQLALRPYDLIALGTTTAGQSVASAPVRLDVERSDSPQSLTAEPADVIQLSVGDQIPLRVVGNFGDGSSSDMSESTQTNYVSHTQSVCTVSADGVIQAISPGSTSITVYNTLHTAASTVISVTVVPIVSVVPASSAIYPAQSKQFWANLAKQAFAPVIWAASPSGTGSIDPSSGLYTAPSSIASQQQVTITATSSTDNSQSASATVLLYPSVTVSVSPATANIPPSASLQLSAIISNDAFYNPQYPAVVWTLGSGGAGSLTATGLYTAPPTLGSVSSVVVTATSITDPTKSASAVLQLTQQ